MQLSSGSWPIAARNAASPPQPHRADADGGDGLALADNTDFISYHHRLAYRYVVALSLIACRPMRYWRHTGDVAAALWLAISRVIRLRHAAKI